MVAAVVALHQGFGPFELDVDFHANGEAEVGVADARISEVTSVGLTEDFFGEATGNKGATYTLAHLLICGCGGPISDSN